MAREIRDLVGYLLLSILLVGSAELIVATLGTPRLWALLFTFIIGYSVVAIVKWRSRTEHTATNDHARADSTIVDGSTPGARARDTQRH